MTDTPELDKLSKVNKTGDNQTIGEFLEWAGENGYHFTKTVTLIEERDYLLKEGTYEVPVDMERPVNIEDVLAEYFGIDMKKVRAEQDAVYAEIRAHAQQ